MEADIANRSFTVSNHHGRKKNPSLCITEQNMSKKLGIFFFIIFKANDSIAAICIKSSLKAQHCLPWRELAKKAKNSIKISMVSNLNPKSGL